MNIESDYFNVIRRRFYIVSEMHCKVLDVKGADPVTGVDAIMWPKKSGYHPNQLWYFDSEGVIRSALNDMALDSGGKTKLIINFGISVIENQLSIIEVLLV